MGPDFDSPSVSFLKRCFQTAALTALVLLFSFGVAEAADVDVQTGFEFTWWRDSERNVGYQGFIPLKLSAQIREFSVSVLGGYAHTAYEPGSGGQNDSLSHPLDTKVNFSYALLDKLPFDVLFGLDFNLPTGKTALNTRDLVLIMDPDLVPITRLGEGYNVNPTVSVAKAWGKWAAGLGVGYNLRGTYDYTTEIRKYSPGDICTVTAETRYEISPSWTARLFGQYDYFAKAKVEGHDFYQEGDFYLAGAGLRYGRTAWDTIASFKYVHRAKSDLQNSAGSL
ncbi:MAG TPA: hypothetical protein VLS90_03265, partial [Thermodesulfobacteriota bacterium]|nr:hypothetical protein [Thermodesulfobacteriota bacterium]